AELFTIPGFGRLIRALNARPVRREGADAGALRAALRVLEGGGAVLVFPEGTRGDEGVLREAKPGAALLAVLSGASVVPVFVRGRVVHVGTSEVLVDVGYKSEGAIPIEEFHRHGALPKVGEEIEVYLEAKEDSEGLIVLSKDKADKIKVWDAITQAYEKGQPV